MRSWAMRTLIVGLMLAADLVLPSPARSQTRLTFIPSVSVSAISDDNIFTTATAIRSADQMTLVGPSLEGSVETPRGSLRGLYSFDMLRSMYFAALNDIEARRHGMFDSHFRSTPRFALGFGGHYDRSENAGELNFETGFLVPRRRAERWELTPGFTYQVSPLVTVRGQYNWVREALEHTMVANEHVARGSVTRQLSTRTSIGTGYLGRHFINGEETQTSHAALLGWSRQLGPFTMLNLVAGPRLSSRGQLAPEITASLVRRGVSLVGYMFDYWRGESIILGVLGPVEVQSATGKITWPILRSVEVGASTGLFKSSSLTQGEARVLDGKLVASWTRAFYTIDASYGADFQHGDIRTSLLSDRDVQRRVFAVKLTIAPRLSRAIQPPGPLDPLVGPSKREKQ
ncbi:MAG: hypothetical protein HY655_03440 [Acidobacteria bacterium]|nr:hypothetical protein [Acidobacteriota bacterium]